MVKAFLAILIKKRKIIHRTQGLGDGVFQSMPDGPRVFGSETKLKAGTDVVIQLDKDLKINSIPL